MIEITIEALIPFIICFSISFLMYAMFGKELIFFGFAWTLACYYLSNLTLMPAEFMGLGILLIAFRSFQLFREFTSGGSGGEGEGGEGG